MPRLFSWLNLFASPVISSPSGPVSGLHIVICWPLPASEQAPAFAVPPPDAGALVAAVPPPDAGALVAAVPPPDAGALVADAPPPPPPPHAAIKLAIIANITARHTRRDMAFIVSLLAIREFGTFTTDKRTPDKPCRSARQPSNGPHGVDEIPIRQPGLQGNRRIG